TPKPTPAGKPSALAPDTALAPNTDQREEVTHEWRWLWRQIRPFIHFEIASLVLMLLASAVSLTSPLLMKWLIDKILPQHAWPDLIIPTSRFSPGGVGGHFWRYTANLIPAAGVMRCSFEIRRRIVGQLTSLPATFFATHPVGDLVQRAETDVSLVSEL